LGIAQAPLGSPVSRPSSRCVGPFCPTRPNPALSSVVDPVHTLTARPIHPVDLLGAGWRRTWVVAAHPCPCPAQARRTTPPAGPGSSTAHEGPGIRSHLLGPPPVTPPPIPSHLGPLGPSSPATLEGLLASPVDTCQGGCASDAAWKHAGPWANEKPPVPKHRPRQNEWVVTGDLFASEPCPHGHRR
jgi:hypothetical protein